MSQTPAGWYPDHQGTVRWWDGTAWTAHTQPPAPQPQVPLAEAEAHASVDPHALVNQQVQTVSGSYDPATGAPVPATKKSPVLTIVIVGIAGLLVIVLAIVFLPKIFGGSSNSPEAAVRGLLNAKSCSEAEEHATDSLLATMGQCDDSDFQSFESSVTLSGTCTPNLTIGDAQSGTDASTVVPVTFACTETPTQTSTINLITTKENGVWKVSGIDLDLPQTPSVG